MQNYKLTASLGEDYRVLAVFAENDTQATINATFEIMDKAYKEQGGPWALGEIKLMSPSGKVLQTMEAKA